MILQPKHCTDGLLEIGLDESSPSLRARETNPPGGVPERACAVGPREVGDERGLAIPVRVRTVLTFFGSSFHSFCKPGVDFSGRGTSILTGEHPLFAQLRP